MTYFFTCLLLSALVSKIWFFRLMKIKLNLGAKFSVHLHRCRLDQKKAGAVFVHSSQVSALKHVRFTQILLYLQMSKVIFP